MEIKKESGFTFIEMMIVISILVIMITITFTLFLPRFEQKQIDHFFKLFERDILYAQLYAISHDRQIFIYIDNDNKQYVIEESGLGQTLYVRKYPSKIEITHQSIDSPITFYSTGNIRQAGSLQVHFKEQRYAVTFMLGKGRFYVKKL